MSVSANFGVLLSLFTLSTLVAGDPELRIVYTSINVTHHPNDYADSWSMEIVDGERGSLINAKIPVKKDVPENLQIQYVVTINGADPIEYASSVCDAFDGDILSQSFISAGFPKGEFPTKCPIKAGDWSIEKWEIPLAIVPPGIPAGPFSSRLTYMEEGKEPYVRIDTEGVLSYV